MVVTVLKLCLLFCLYHNAQLLKNTTTARKYTKLKKDWHASSGNKDKYVLNTPGCTIPNVWKNYRIVEANDCENSCGIRAVHIEKSDKINMIKFIINDKNMRKILGKNPYECCYQFVYEVAIDKIAYTECKPFKHGTVLKLLHEVITVKCRRTKNKTYGAYFIGEGVFIEEGTGWGGYNDAYIILKRNPKLATKLDANSWNVLIVGMDTMSRARAIQNMPKLVKYFHKNGWLDYRGYQKGSTFTAKNLMILHTGKPYNTIHAACDGSMAKCNHLMIWSEFKKSGYVTAYACDDIPDAFQDYGEVKENLTDHYNRPLLLVGTQKLTNLVCLRTQPSAYNVLSYAYQFAKEYRNEKFFGFYWIWTYSHDPNTTPKLLEKQLIQFFKKLNNAGTMKNTIIIFLGDHGETFGRLKIPVESHYGARLPMLFMWYPLSFRERYTAEFVNLQLNQYRLTTHCDMYSTLWNILKLSDKKVQIRKPEVCPKCKSLFKEKSKYRTCKHMNVSEKMCSCHVLHEVHSSDISATLVPEILRYNLQVKLLKDVQIKRILRHHWYRNKHETENITYYVIAIQLVPGDEQYEATIKKTNWNYEILDDIDRISPYAYFYNTSLCPVMEP